MPPAGHAQQTALVVTTIASVNPVLAELASGAAERGTRFIVAGDESSPADFALPGSDYFDIQRQLDTGFRTAAAARRRHYARKNVGYLAAMQAGAEVIVETDDDNYPLASFWDNRQRTREAAAASRQGWINVYRYFSDAIIWPRGLPLDSIHAPLPPRSSLPVAGFDAPIQQGLANEAPDVDAIHRLVFPQAVYFRTDAPIALKPGCWCPFNSQNTTWWRDAFPLLYLPSWCTFRMTDIWRSFVAQRIAWENDWVVLFHSATVRQERNAHQLLRDFEDEVPGYLHNRRIAECLEQLTLKAGLGRIPENMRICYEALVRGGWVEDRELEVLDAWLADVRIVFLRRPAMDRSGDLSHC